MDRSRLEDGARIGVIGGGPAGSFQSFFLFQLARRAGIEVEIDLYEPRRYDQVGPGSCNMCGGIVSESLLQSLVAEGINLPPEVIHRRLDSYFLHMDVGSVRIETPQQEKRIAAVHRGSGPRGAETALASFDRYLFEMAVEAGARPIPERVKQIDRVDGRPRVRATGDQEATYDLLVVATGINAPLLKSFEELGIGYRRPKSAKAGIAEFRLGGPMIDRYLGNSMHVFLLDVPRLKFAALIPKSEYVTACLLGEDLDKQAMLAFLESPEVRGCMPPHWAVPSTHCRCSPKIVTGSATRPFADRIVFVGDCGTTRLYKDGIGAAYRMAKAAARAAIFHGVSAESFGKHYWPACRSINRDNDLGRMVFSFTRLIQRWRPLRRSVWHVTSGEQPSLGARPRMGPVLWDTFTGSATYASVLSRSMHPALVGRLAKGMLAGRTGTDQDKKPQEGKPMPQDITGFMGKKYRRGDVIYHQGERGDCVFVVQEGEVELIRREQEKEFCLGTMTRGNMFGEQVLFDDLGLRWTTARAISDVYVFTLPKRDLLKRLDQDPSLAFQLLKRMDRRIRELENSLIRLGGRAWEPTASA